MFSGVITALVTPFKKKEVDWDALDRLVEFQVRNRVSGIVACGTTGESATLSPEEHALVIERIIKAARKRVKVIAGTGTNCTAESIERTFDAQQMGADGALVIPPYYTRPPQAGLIAHFEAGRRSSR